jgi:hypothetical protein
LNPTFGDDDGNWYFLSDWLCSGCRAHYSSSLSTKQMNKTTISFTFDKNSINPLMLQDALWKLLDVFDIEVLETEVSNVTEEENTAWECATS